MNAVFGPVKNIIFNKQYCFWSSKKHAKQKHPGCKKGRGHSEAALQIGMYNQKL